MVLTEAANSMSLPGLVAKYLALAGSFGPPVPLDAFGIPHHAAEILWSALDEDYQISRFLHFSLSAGSSYSINGFPQTHLAIDAGISSLL